MGTFMDVDDVKNMEGDDDDEEEDGKRVLAVVALHGAPFPFPQKMNYPDLSHYFGSIAWCRRSNIVACATETCARFVMSNSDHQPAFWIPVHVFDPERPTEHTVFNVTADSPSDSIQVLEWSPSTCEQALLVGNTGGRITIWSHPTKGPSNVARAVNSWMCEYEWRQEPAVMTRWVTGPSPYRFSSTSSVGQPSTKSLEERFLSHVPRSSVRWPSLLCIVSIFYSGSVQLHWRKWPPSQTDSPPKWFCTNKAILGAGPSGLFAADTIVTKCGSLVVAGTPVGTPSTVIVWEVSPWVTNAPAGNQPPHKYGLPAQAPRAFGPPAWPGMSPLAAYLISWQEQPGVESTSGTSHADKDAKEAGPLLQCSPISNLSAYVAPDANMLTTWGSGIVEIAFDPSLGGSALVTVLCEGYFVSPEVPENGPALTGWRYQRWESSTQPVAIHPLFETGGGNFPSSSPHGTVTIWTAVSNNFIPPKGSTSKSGGSLLQADIRTRLNIMQRPVNPRCISNIVFSSTGAEFALSLVSGEVYVFSVFSATPIESFTVHSVLNVAPAVAFSPTGCCLASVWHSKKTDRSQVKVLCLEPSGSTANNQGGIGAPSTWERHLADRFWWSLVADLDWWDIVACAFSAVQDGAATVARVTAVLDTDFHALPNHLHRQSCSNALDRLKCRMLEGYDSADNRALVLDMQARLLLDLMGKGIEAALMNPTGIVVEPWTASSEALQGLGHESMAVDPALVPTIQAYVDTILDLASHFLTRLRRYASFCRTLASHAVTNSSSISNSRPGVNSSNGNTRASQPGQGSAPQSGSGNHSSGTASVQAWVQGAIAKINSTAEGVAANAPSTGLAPGASLPLTVSTATFPGIPAVRLIGDRVFLHRLCQLLFFSLVFRKRQLPRYLPVPSRLAADSTSVANKAAAGGSVVPKSEDVNGTSTTARPTTSGVSSVKMEDGARTLSVNKSEDGPLRPPRIGNGNGGQGYTPDEVKVLFLVIVDLCKKTHLHPHPVPKSEVGVSNPMPRLHFVDGQYQVQPEIIEAALGPHMQQLPRPRGADAAGLLMRELELHPPSEDWNRRSLAFGPWSNTVQRDLKSFDEGDQEANEFAHELWPRKRRYAERDVALGMKSAIGLGSFSGFMGSRRDVITGIWKTSQHAVWHRCLRCGRQTASLASPMVAAPGSALPTSTRESWWTGRWVNGCPACGGRWVRFHL